MNIEPSLIPEIAKKVDKKSVGGRLIYCRPHVPTTPPKPGKNDDENTDVTAKTDSNNPDTGHGTIIHKTIESPSNVTDPSAVNDVDEIETGAILPLDENDDKNSRTQTDEIDDKNSRTQTENNEPPVTPKLTPRKPPSPVAAPPRAISLIPGLPEDVRQKALKLKKPKKNSKTENSGSKCSNITDEYEFLENSDDKDLNDSKESVDNVTIPNDSSVFSTPIALKSDFGKKYAMKHSRSRSRSEKRSAVGSPELVDKKKQKSLKSGIPAPGNKLKKN